MEYDDLGRECFYQAAYNAQQEALLGLQGARANMQQLVHCGVAEVTSGESPIES